MKLKYIKWGVINFIRDIGVLAREMAEEFLRLTNRWDWGYENGFNRVLAYKTTCVICDRTFISETIDCVCDSCKKNELRKMMKKEMDKKCYSFQS